MKQKRLVFLVAAAVTVGVSSTVAFATQAFEDTSRTDMVVASGSERRASQTAEDWVTYADHVIHVRAVSEEEGSPEPEEIERGEGTISRVVTLDVQQVLWSSDSAPRPAPQTYEYPTWGSMFTDGDLDNPIPMGSLDQPRVEVGHEYVIAIDWEDPRCSPGDESWPGGWLGLGSGSIVPADDGVIGNGENAGEVTSADDRSRSSTFTEHHSDSFEGQMLGESVDSLAQELGVTTPDAAPQTFSVPAEATACE